jgi:hypothetical protein
MQLLERKLLFQRLTSKRSEHRKFDNGLRKLALDKLNTIAEHLHLNLEILPGPFLNNAPILDPRKADLKMVDLRFSVSELGHMLFEVEDLLLAG